MKKENLITPKTILKVRVNKGNGASLQLFKPHSMTPDRIEPLYVDKNPNDYCFNQDVSEYRHYIVKNNFEDEIEHELS